MTAVQKSSDKSEFETPFNGEIQGAQLQPVFDQFNKRAGYIMQFEEK